MRNLSIAAMAWATLSIALPTSSAQAVQLLDTQPNTHWRADLREQSDSIVSQRIDKALRANELGCRRYCATLANIFQRVTQAASAQVPNSQPIEWELIVTRSSDDDAYALPDGRIIISEIFIARERLNEDELAFVIAHEASHVILTHEADRLDTVQSLLPHGVNQSIQDIYAAMDFSIALLLKISPLMVRMEEEADQTGLMLAALAGFKPDVAIGYVERMATAAQQSSIAATHPAGTRRASQLRETLPMALRIYQRFWNADASIIRNTGM